MGFVSLLEYLPFVRKVFLTILMVTGVFDLVASIVLLAYQLALTETFQHVVPAIVATSFLCAAFPVWFLFSRPYAIKLPLSPNLAAEPRAGGARDKVAKFSRSIAAEVICLAGTGAWVLVAVSTLHAETPGLISHCGGWAICRMLLCVVALTWICFLFLCLSFASLLVCTLYFTVRRSSPLPLLLTSFNSVDWERYAGRPVARAGTVKLPRRTKAEREASKAERDGPTRDGRSLREGSEAPVLPSHHHRTGLGQSISTIGTGGLDWDVQSTFTAPSLPYGAYARDSRPNSLALSTATANGAGLGISELAQQELEKEREQQQQAGKEESVFVLVEDEPAEEVGEKKDGAVGAAK
ncbi:hypothetical protein JCM10207_007054 [Rhodosporidiobolus poonsookiae]